MLRFSLRLLFPAVLAMALPAAASAEPVRISYQRSSTLLITLKQSGELERRLNPLGLEISWQEVTGSVIPAMTARSADFHADVADAAPIFAQAENAPLVYYAKEIASPAAQAILTQKGSPIRDVGDLTGKRIAVQPGSGAHYLLIASLAKAGLKPDDVVIAPLQPQDARAAFDRGEIDAWATWDPFVAEAEAEAGARVIADGRKGVSAYNRYYLVDRDFAARRPDVVGIVYQALQDAGRWVKSNRRESARALAPIWGLGPDIVEKIAERRSYDVRPVGWEDLADQQKIADVFAAAKLFSKAVDLKDALVVDPTRLSQQAAVRIE